MAKMKIGIIGATGMVGQEMEKVILEDKSFQGAELFYYASSDKKIGTKNIEAYNPDKTGDLDYILGASDADTAKIVGSNLKAHQVFIDNSSAFRADKNCPLVVPEINGALLDSKPSVVANPNCTAILLCMTLAPLQKTFGLRRVTVSTYQAASGAGIKGLEELENQILAYSKNESAGATCTVFGHPLHLNIMSHNSLVREEGPGLGYNDEEWKVITETQKILAAPKLEISATCMRVPVKRAHTETVTVDLEKPFELSEIEALFSKTLGLKTVHNIAANRFPMPLDAQNQDLVLVGRWRKDAFRPQTLHYILAGDQVRKGAATNAVQILKYMAKI